MNDAVFGSTSGSHIRSDRGCEKRLEALAGLISPHLISDDTFDEEFIAQPKQDHVFVMWSHGSLCAFRRIP